MTTPTWTPLLFNTLPFTTDVLSSGPPGKGCACWPAKARQIVLRLLPLHLEPELDQPADSAWITGRSANEPLRGRCIPTDIRDFVVSPSRGWAQRRQRFVSTLGGVALPGVLD